MYTSIDKLQHPFLDFNQSMGLKMNSENCWIKMADLIPSNEFEIRYVEQFPSGTGNVTKPFRSMFSKIYMNNVFAIFSSSL